MMTKSIQEIKEEFQAADQGMQLELLQKYESDSRKGVQNLLQKVKKEQEKLQKEMDRLDGMKFFERKYASYEQICGIDEAGRGPLAGPVVAAAVILPKDSSILYLNDSKKVSASRREQLYEQIMDQAIAYGVGIVSPERIDEINILQATYEAMREAINQLTVPPDMLLVDAVTIPKVSVKQVGIIKGDAKSVSIAAASIIAKVTRDHMMEAYDELYPGYGFAEHKGYGTKAHQEAILKKGMCPIHRKTFLGNILTGV